MINMLTKAMVGVVISMVIGALGNGHRQSNIWMLVCQLEVLK